MINFKLFVNKIKMKLWIKKNLDFNKYKYFFCPSGIGDTLYVLSYMKEYKKNNPNIQVCFIIKKSHFSLVQMYNQYIDNVIILNLNIFNCLSKYLINKREDSNIIYAHPLRIIYDPCKILGIRGINLLDLYKVILELPFESELCLPMTSNKSKKNIDKVFNERKKILLCPYCVSTSTISIEIWEYIATFFKKRGFKVYTNIKDSTEKPIKNTKPLYLELEEMYVIANTFYHIFSIRSGLCDLLSLTKVDLTVFYKADNNKKNISKEYDIYNFKNIGVRKDINELIVSDKNDIINYMKKFY